MLPVPTMPMPRGVMDGEATASVVVAAGRPGSPSMAYRQRMRTDQIALQLYTLRRLAADDLPGTLAAVAATGYRAVEVAGLPETTPAELARLLGDAGLSAIAAHVSI